jgi:hypothetical protein
MKAIFLVLALIAFPAAAQQAQPPQETITLHLTPAQAVLVGKALGKLPYEEAWPLILDFQKQVAAQVGPDPKEAPK